MSIFSRFSKKISIEKQKQENSLVIGNNETNEDTKQKPVLSKNQLLIWYSTGSNKNYKASQTVKTFGNISLTYSNNEPSAIDVNLPISEIPADPNINIMYWPSYDQLNPNQRKTYLNWLDNGAKDIISIGYVFIYYYGLERWLLTEKWETAFNEILRISKIQTKLKEYCKRVLTFIAIIKNRFDLLDVLNEYGCLDYIIHSYLDLQEHGYITADDLFGSLDQAGLLSNSNYYKKNYELYKEIFYEIMDKQNNKIIIQEFDSEGCQKSWLFVNKSMSADCSLNELPNIFTDKKVLKTCNYILNDVHENVKKRLKNIRQDNPVERKSKEEKVTNPNIVVKENLTKIDFNNLCLKAIQYGKLFPVEDLSTDIGYNTVNSKTIDDKLQQAYSRIEDDCLKKLIKRETTMQDVINSRSYEEVLEKWGTSLISKGFIHEAMEISKIIFNSEASYSRFMSAHFLLNYLMNVFYPKIKENQDYKDICYSIGQMDFVLTCSYDFLNKASLPCITKLVQLLENDLRYEEALDIIHIYESKEATSEIQELLPKKNRILKKRNGKS